MASSRGERGGAQRHQGRQADTGQHDAHGAAQQREDQALGEEVAGQAPPAGAQGGTHGELTPPPRAAGQEEERQIGARDHEEKRHCAHEDEHDGPGVRRGGIPEPTHRGSPGPRRPIRARELGQGMPGDGVQRLPGIVGSHARSRARRASPGGVPTPGSRSPVTRRVVLEEGPEPGRGCRRRSRSPAGMTPTTVYGSPSRRSSAPPPSGSASKRLRHRASLRITRRGPPGPVRGRRRSPRPGPAERPERRSTRR